MCLLDPTAVKCLCKTSHRLPADKLLQQDENIQNSSQNSSRCRFLFKLNLSQHINTTDFFLNTEAAEEDDRLKNIFNLCATLSKQLCAFTNLMTLYLLAGNNKSKSSNVRSLPNRANNAPRGGSGQCDIAAGVLRERARDLTTAVQSQAHVLTPAT